MSVDPKARREDRKARGLPDPSEAFEPMPWVTADDLDKHGEKHTAAVTGWEWYESPKKGTPGLDIRWVIVDGPLAGKQAGSTLWFSTTSDYALDVLADMAICFGWEEPFDERNDDDLEKVFTNGSGLLVLVLKTEDSYENSKGDEVTPVKPAFYNASRKKADDEVKALVKRGEAAFNGYLKWREENPRGAARAQASSDDDEGSEGSDYSSSDAEDEIPF